MHTSQISNIKMASPPSSPSKDQPCGFSLYTDVFFEEENYLSGKSKIERRKNRRG
jgi:hypothetical protein